MLSVHLDIYIDVQASGVVYYSGRAVMTGHPLPAGKQRNEQWLNANVL